MVCFFLPTMPVVKNYGASSTLHVFNCSAEDKRAAIFLSQPLQQAKLKMPLTHVGERAGSGAAVPNSPTLLLPHACIPQPRGGPDLNLCPSLSFLGIFLSATCPEDQRNFPAPLLNIKKKKKSVEISKLRKYWKSTFSAGQCRGRLQVY